MDTCMNLPPNLDQLLSTQPYGRMTQRCEFLTEDGTDKILKVHDEKNMLQFF